MEQTSSNLAADRAARPSFRARSVTGEPVVRIRNLTHTFGDGETAKQVLIDANLDLQAGEIVIMTGPSGSGKTTLLTLIGALRSVQEGLVTILGQDLSRLSGSQLVTVRRQIGFIFQAHNLFAALSATQNVRMALELHPHTAREMNERAAEMLGKVGLGQRLHHKPAQLSGGQKQRVAIARALVNRPKLILADEPTAALDRESGREVVTLLRKLADDEGATILLVTHDNRILDVADRIVNLIDGRIVSNVDVKEGVAVCEFLRVCPIFKDLTTEAVTELGRKMTPITFKKGQVMIQQGDDGDRFFVIRRGSASVLETREGKQSRKATLSSGQYFGEVALLTRQPRNATVIADEEVEVYTLSKDDFDAALEALPPLKQQLLKTFFASKEA